MQLELSQEEKVDLLISLSQKMGVTPDEILALYLLLDDRIFFLFDLLQGKTIKIPSLRVLQRGLASLGGFKLQKLRKAHYLVNGVDSYKEDIKRGDTVSVSGVDLVSLSSPHVIFGDTYILCKE